MPKRVPLPISLRGTTVRSSDASAHGLGPGRLRSADVGHPFHGVSTVEFPIDSVIAACKAFEPVLRPSTCFSHSTAAALYGAPLPRRLQGLPVHVSAVGMRTQPRRKGVIGHVLGDVSLQLRLGFPVTAPAVTWFLLATELSHRDLVAAGDFFVTGFLLRGGQRAEPFCTLSALVDVVHANEGRRGAVAAAAALIRVRVGADSPMETFTRILIVDSGLPEPVVGAEVLVDGRALHPDLAYPELRLAIEYEGEEHRLEPRRFRSDITRRELFEAADWRVTRVTSDDVFLKPAEFLRRLRLIIDQRTHEIA